MSIPSGLPSMVAGSPSIGSRVGTTGVGEGTAVGAIWAVGAGPTAVSVALTLSDTSAGFTVGAGVGLPQAATSKINISDNKVLSSIF